MSHPLSPKRLLTALAVTVLVGGGATIYDEVLSVEPQAPAVEQPVPPHQEEPLEETDLAHIKSVLGPFEAIAVSQDSPTPETHYPAVLILNQDGSTLASKKWTVPFSTTSWAKKDAFQIDSLSVQLGYVTIGTNRQRSFVVKANQPFIFEEAPQQVHLIDAQGNTWVINSARAEALRQAV